MLWKVTIEAARPIDFPGNPSMTRTHYVDAQRPHEALDELDGSDLLDLYHETDPTVPHKAHRIIMESCGDLMVAGKCPRC